MQLWSEKLCLPFSAFPDIFFLPIGKCFSLWLSAFENLIYWFSSSQAHHRNSNHPPLPLTQLAVPQGLLFSGSKHACSWFASPGDRLSFSFSVEIILISVLLVMCGRYFLNGHNNIYHPTCTQILVIYHQKWSLLFSLPSHQLIAVINTMWPKWCDVTAKSRVKIIKGN